MKKVICVFLSIILIISNSSFTEAAPKNNDIMQARAQIQKIADEYEIKIRFLPMNSLKSNDKLQTINLDDLSEVMKDMKNITTVDCPIQDVDVSQQIFSPQGLEQYDKWVSHKFKRQMGILFPIKFESSCHIYYRFFQGFPFFEKAKDISIETTGLTIYEWKQIDAKAILEFDKGVPTATISSYGYLTTSFNVSIGGSTGQGSIGIDIPLQAIGDKGYLTDSFGTEEF